MHTPPEQCCYRYLLIEPTEIHFLRFLIDAYEGIGVVSTLDSALGLVQIATAPGCEEDIAQILDSERHILKPRDVPADSPLITGEWVNG